MHNLTHCWQRKKHRVCTLLCSALLIASDKLGKRAKCPETEAETEAGSKAAANPGKAKAAPTWLAYQKANTTNKHLRRKLTNCSPLHKQRELAQDERLRGEEDPLSSRDSRKHNRRRALEKGYDNDKVMRIWRRQHQKLLQHWEIISENP